MLPLPVPSVVPLPSATRARTQFTMADRLAVERWRGETACHGYRRVVIESGEGYPDYALVYCPDRLWAVWGLTRGASGVLVWHCGTGADFGRFATMAKAFAELPVASPGAVTARSAAAPPPPPCRLRVRNS